MLSGALSRTLADQHNNALRAQQSRDAIANGDASMNDNEGERERWG